MKSFWQSNFRLVCLIVAILSLWATLSHAEQFESQPAKAESDVVWVLAEASTYKLNVSREFPTDLWFDSEIIEVKYTNKQSFLVQPTGPARVTVRPRPGAKDGAIAVVTVVTATMKLAIMLRVVKNIDHAKLQRDFQRRPTTTRVSTSESERWGTVIGNLYHRYYERYILRQQRWAAERFKGSRNRCPVTPSPVM